LRALVSQRSLTVTIQAIDVPPKTAFSRRYRLAFFPVFP
jgi:hypothetical protein